MLPFKLMLFKFQKKFSFWRKLGNTFRSGVFVTEIGPLNTIFIPIIISKTDWRKPR